MPTYEYECLECKHRFDIFHSMNDSSVKTCEKCGKDVRKIFGAAGIIFKGNGFYVNDYKNNGSPASPKKSTDKSADSKNASPCSSCDACPA